MKISIINQFVVGAIVAAIMTGCGGSGVALSDSSFKSGIYFSVVSPNATQCIGDMTGSGLYDVNLPADVLPMALCMGSSNKLYVGSGNTVILMTDKTSPLKSFTFPAGTSATNINAVATDQVGRIYANDYNNRRILRIDNINGSNLKILDYQPFMNGLSDDNVSLAIDSLNRIYIGLRSNGTLLRFNNMTDASPVSFGQFGNGTNQFYGIYDIAFDATSRIYIVDRYNDRIVRIDDMNGTNWTTFGANGSGSNQFNNPTKIGIGPDGAIYVGDPKNGRIARFTDLTGQGWTTYQATLANLTDILVR